MPQLARAATYQGLSWRVRKWAYQAKVMKTLEQMSRTTGFQMVGSSITSSALSSGICSGSARQCIAATRYGHSQRSNACHRLALAPRRRTVEIPDVCGVFGALEILCQMPFLRRNGRLDAFHPERRA